MISRKAFFAGATLALGLNSTGKAQAEYGYSFNAVLFDNIVNAPAKHKMCFGSTYSGGGVALELMTHFLDSYERREGPGTAHAIAVFYRETAFAMALDDGFWRDVLAPYVRKGGAERAQIWGDASRNPYLNNPARGSATISNLAKRGAQFFLCNATMTRYAEAFARELGELPSTVYQKMVVAMVPSAMRVPEGVMAVNAAQEAHFTYIQATLS